MSEPESITDTLRASVSAGIIDEALAARVAALAQERAGARSLMPKEDEPFEFFRGFSEIFISVGLIILFFGTVSLGALFAQDLWAPVVPLMAGALAWWWATYFTLKRRMTLPSMVLATGFALAAFSSALLPYLVADFDLRVAFLVASCVSAVAMIFWFRRFRLPFSAFLIGAAVLVAAYSLAFLLRDDRFLHPFMGVGGFFDLSQHPLFAFATLFVGLGAFVTGMIFDMRDPHRLGRHAATAFWCHMLAAPALVNTIAVTALSGSGIAVLVPILIVLTAMALIIDRRSFLTAAIAYFAVVLFSIAEPSALRSFFVLLTLGAFITAIGTWWVPLRARVMRVLPDFPGKNRLPPYSMPE